MGRPDGVTKRATMIDAIMVSTVARSHRKLISSKIRGQAGLGEADSTRPSAHLRWALQQMKLRGWTNTEWGNLITDYETGQLGDGPICLLESVRAPFDNPAVLKFESVEQKYLRLAFVQLGVDPVPVYVSIWNDEQDAFEPIERLLNMAIDTAEADERDGVERFADLLQEDLMLMFHISQQALDAASDALTPEAEADAKPEDFLSKLLGGGFEGQLKDI